jgi:hypothetical protein
MSCGEIFITRRPKPWMSGSEGCAPIATPLSSARRTVLRIVAGSPPWKPQAMFAELMNGMMPASSPIFQAP